MSAAGQVVDKRYFSALDQAPGQVCIERMNSCGSGCDLRQPLGISGM